MSVSYECPLTYEKLIGIVHGAWKKPSENKLFEISSQIFWFKELEFTKLQANEGVKPLKFRLILKCVENGMESIRDRFPVSMT